MTDSDSKTAIESRQTTPVHGIVKVGKEGHMKALRDGKLYCRPLSYYSKIEGEPLPHQDAHEGLRGVFQSNKVEVTFRPSNGNPIVLNAESGLIGQVLITYKYDSPVFCMHAIYANWVDQTSKEEEIDATKLEALRIALQIPMSMDKFGKYVWVITNCDEFTDRIRTACIAQSLQLRGDVVRYVDPQTFHGPLPHSLRGLVKLDSFKEERELRFIIESRHELPDPFIMDVGSLHDISFVTTLAELRQGWTIGLRDP